MLPKTRMRLTIKIRPSNSSNHLSHFSEHFMGVSDGSKTLLDTPCNKPHTIEHNWKDKIDETMEIVERFLQQETKQPGKKVLSVVLTRASGIETRAQSAYLACAGCSSRRRLTGKSKAAKENRHRSVLCQWGQKDSRLKSSSTRNEGTEWRPRTIENQKSCTRESKTQKSIGAQNMQPALLRASRKTERKTGSAEMPPRTQKPKSGCDEKSVTVRATRNSAVKKENGPRPLLDEKSVTFHATRNSAVKKKTGPRPCSMHKTETRMKNTERKRPQIWWHQNKMVENIQI
jgi:hypothetical protein